MTSSRSDWCISRQRTWGVPIPVFYHLQSREPLMNEETIDHIKSIIAQKGGDAWWYMTVEDLLPTKYHDKAAEYEKGTDTMDVWFDSGSSWAAVLGKRDSLSFPADLYLEGTDQHRGWFQSSLLTGVATRGWGLRSCVRVRGVVPNADSDGYMCSERGWCKQMMIHGFCHMHFVPFYRIQKSCAASSPKIFIERGSERAVEIDDYATHVNASTSKKLKTVNTKNNE